MAYSGGGVQRGELLYKDWGCLQNYSTNQAWRCIHDLLHLLRKNRPIFQRVKLGTITVTQWCDSSISRLKRCFEITDWFVFTEACDGMDEFTETISYDIQFCEDNIIPSKQVKCYSNKLWITREIKKLVNLKKGLYERGDRDVFKYIQKQLKSAIKQVKRNYKKRIESHFTENDMKRVWSGMRLMSGTQLVRKYDYVMFRLNMRKT